MRPEAHKGALVATGVIAIVVGGLSAFTGLMTLFMVNMPGFVPAGREGSATFAFAFAACFWGLAATSLIWLGIGTVRARRWGRALLLAGAWIWLVLDALMLCGIVSLMASGDRPHIGRAEIVLFAASAGFAMLVFVGMPLAFVLVLGRAGMKEAVEALDPTPRWTDRRPLPILGTSLFLLGVSVVYVVMALGQARLWHLAGSSARMGYALLALLFAVGAVGLWRGLAIAFGIAVVVYLGLVASLSADLWDSGHAWPFLVAVPMYVAGAAFLWRLRRHVV